MHTGAPQGRIQGHKGRCHCVQHLEDVRQVFVDTGRAVLILMRIAGVCGHRRGPCPGHSGPHPAPGGAGLALALPPTVSHALPMVAQGPA